MRWDPATRSLTFRLPHWADVLAGLRHRRMVRFILFIIFLDVLMASVDLPLADVMRGLDPEIVLFFNALTKAGDSKYWLVPIALCLPFLIATRQATADGSLRRMLSWGTSALVFIFVAVAGSGLLVDVLKALFGRARPRLWVEADIYGFAPLNFYDSLYASFPSGHATTAFAVATAVACFFPRLRNLLWLLAVPVAMSRVVIVRHYLSDVIAGAVIGALFTLWLRDHYARRGWVFVRQHGTVRLRAPGQLLFSKARTATLRVLHLPDGARGRLP